MRKQVTALETGKEEDIAEESGAEEETSKEDELPETSEVEPSDNRTLLTLAEVWGTECMLIEHLENCSSTDFNFDPASTRVTYSNSEQGITFSVPYNPNWGSDFYRILPYEESPQNKNTLKFGPIGPFEGRGLDRYQLSLTFTESKSVEEVLADYDNPIDGSGVFHPAQKRNINDLEVVQYGESGMGNFYSILVIGNKYNYNFTKFGGFDQEAEFQKLEDIVKTVHLF